MSFEYTTEQKEAIAQAGNMVIVACPGSGKTTVIVEKIKQDLISLPQYQGIIGITFTKKASKEITQKIAKGCFNTNSSFIGTIDQFCLSEIIYPFGRHAFSMPHQELECIKFEDLPQSVLDELQSNFGANNVGQISSNFIEVSQFLFMKGIVLLNFTSQLAQFVLSKSNSCQRYIAARYKAIYIDEYQDTSSEQHRLFLSILNYGLKGIVVGDINQSIYKWRDGKPEYLLQLSERNDFAKHTIYINHRCHPSITNYANRLLEPHSQLTKCDYKRIYHARFTGTQLDAFKQIEQIVYKLREKYTDLKYSDIAILVRNNSSLELFDEHLPLPHVVYRENPLHNSNSSHLQMCHDILKFRYDLAWSATDIVEKYCEKKSQKHKSQLIDVIKICRDIEQSALAIYIKNLCPLLLESELAQTEFEILSQVIENKKFINMYTTTESINVMTVHKSKGLEFKAVFIMDLYQYIFPKYDFTTWEIDDYEQELNLLFVGVTRAINHCFLITTTSRLNSNLELKNGAPSVFMELPNIKGLYTDLTR